MAQTNRVPILLIPGIVAAIIAISTASIFIRFAQTDGMPSLVIATFRLAFATLLLAPVLLIKHVNEIKRFTWTEILTGVLSGFFLALHFATWISSLEYTSVASSAVFVSTGPLWVALLSPFVLHEKVAVTAIFGLVLSLAGGMIIGFADICSWNHGITCPDLKNSFQGNALWGNFLSLFGAWAITGYLIIGRKIRAGMSLVPYIFLVYSMAGVFLVSFTLISGASLIGYRPNAYIWALLLAVVPQLMGHSIFNWALKYMPATFVAGSTLGEPVGSAILAAIFLKELPSNAVIFGGILIFAGILLASNQQYKSQELI